MLQPKRQYVINNLYRFGFAGKENDDEVKGNGNQQNYGERIYNPREGRFLSVDPLTKGFSMLTPYQYASNSPISHTDIDGKEGLWFIYAKSGVYGATVSKIANGTEDGVKASVTNAWNFITKDAWKGETWKQTGLFLEEASLGLSTVKISETPRVNAAVGLFQDEVINGDAYTRAKFISQTSTDILIGIAADKGIGELKSLSIFKGMSITEKIAIRRSFARLFYEKEGFSSAKALEHIEGIDFAKPVQTVTLKKGAIIQQWVGRNGIGDYFTTMENGAAKNLGISYEGRTLKQFTLTEDVKVLKSTVADYKGHAGGGIQYFSTELKDKITR